VPDGPQQLSVEQFIFEVDHRRPSELRARDGEAEGRRPGRDSMTAAHRLHQLTRKLEALRSPRRSAPGDPRAIESALRDGTRTSGTRAPIAAGDGLRSRCGA
jgi:hypothetical protein